MQKNLFEAVNISVRVFNALWQILWSVILYDKLKDEDNHLLIVKSYQYEGIHFESN